MLIFNTLGGICMLAAYLVSEFNSGPRAIPHTLYGMSYAFYISALVYLFMR